MQAELPALFLQRLERIVPSDALESCLRSFSIDKPTSFRINTLKRSPESVRTELEAQGIDLTPVPWQSGAFQVNRGQRRALTESDAWVRGEIYIQGLSSMLAPRVLDPRPGETVLDLAAAPGGKTLQMAAMMENRGRLSAVEPVKPRFFRLKANLDRQGASMVRCYRMDGRAVGTKVPERFDRVLLDAPCSSESRFDTREPASWGHWNLKKIRESARKQKRLLDSAFRSLRPGGVLVYCTCSFAPEENELVIEALLKRYGEALAIEPSELPLPNLQSGLSGWEGETLSPALRRAVRVLPTADMDGFFLCRMTKKLV